MRKIQKRTCIFVPCKKETVALKEDTAIEMIYNDFVGRTSSGNGVMICNANTAKDACRRFHLGTINDHQKCNGAMKRTTAQVPRETYG